MVYIFHLRGLLHFNLRFHSKWLPVSQQQIRCKQRLFSLPHQHPLHHIRNYITVSRFCRRQNRPLDVLGRCILPVRTPPLQYTPFFSFNSPAPPAAWRAPTRSSPSPATSPPSSSCAASASRAISQLLRQTAFLFYIQPLHYNRFPVLNALLSGTPCAQLPCGLLSPLSSSRTY